MTTDFETAVAVARDQVTCIPNLKPKNFDGTNWDGYRVQFESLANRNGWDSETKAGILETMLVGEAVDVLVDIPIPCTYQTLADALESRFGLKWHASRFMTQLVARVQHPKEGVTEYHKAFVTLGRRAWPTGISGGLEDLIIYHFMKGLRDPGVRERVTGAGPRTLDEAFEISLRYENISQMSGAFRAVEAVDQQEVLPDHQVKKVAEAPATQQP